jgi:hypothetical protein
MTSHRGLDGLAKDIVSRALIGILTKILCAYRHSISHAL